MLFYFRMNDIMYKTVFLDSDADGWDEIQDRNVDKLNQLLNDEYENG